jgi:hypothetical protein
MKCPFLSCLINVSLKSSLSDISIASPACFWGPLAWRSTCLTVFFFVVLGLELAWQMLYHLSCTPTNPLNGSLSVKPRSRMAAWCSCCTVILGLSQVQSQSLPIDSLPGTQGEGLASLCWQHQKPWAHAAICSGCFGPPFLSWAAPLHFLSLKPQAWPPGGIAIPVAMETICCGMALLFIYSLSLLSLVATSILTGRCPCYAG